MTKTLRQVVASLPQRERRKIAARTKQLVAEEMTLRDLRKAIGQTQVTVGKRLRIGQEAVSKLETRGDMYISTLRGLVRAMGGELELVARFRDRAPVRLEQLGKASLRRIAKRSAAA